MKHFVDVIVVKGVVTRSRAASVSAFTPTSALAKEFVELSEVRNAQLRVLGLLIDLTRHNRQLSVLHNWILDRRIRLRELI